MGEKIKNQKPKIKNKKLVRLERVVRVREEVVKAAERSPEGKNELNGSNGRYGKGWGAFRLPQEEEAMGLMG